MMKTKYLKILTIASVLSLIGLLLDNDTKEPNTIMRFVEFIMMLGITIALISLLYFMYDFAKRNFIKA